MDVVMRVNLAEAAAGKPAGTAPPKPATRALVHPWLDFWLLGGLSFVGLGVMWLAIEIMGFNIEGRVPWWAYYAAFAVNYPHFAYSYQLFYKSYTRRLIAPETEWHSRLRLAIAGIIVPMLMIGYFIQAGLLQDRQLLGYGVSAMLFFVGWHYVKQGYGVLITTSVYKGIFYGVWQKRALYVNAYAIWAYAWLKGNVMLAQHKYYDVSYYTIDLPRVWMTYAGWVALVTSVVAGAVLLWVWLKEKKASRQAVSSVMPAPVISGCCCRMYIRSSFSLSRCSIRCNTCPLSINSKRASFCTSSRRFRRKKPPHASAAGSGW